MPEAKNHFYTNDPMPFVNSESVVKVRILLECSENTGKSQFEQITHLCFYNTKALDICIFSFFRKKNQHLSPWCNISKTTLK